MEKGNALAVGTRLGREGGRQGSTCYIENVKSKRKWKGGEKSVVGWEEITPLQFQGQKLISGSFSVSSK